MSRKNHRDGIRKTKTRDSDCCSVNFVKYVLHIFNVIFFLSGFIVMGVAIWTIFCKHEYISLLTTSNYLFGTYALLVAGILAFFGGFLGCCGVWREQRAMILGYTFILLLVFLLETTVGSLAYLYQTQIKNELNLTLTDTFQQNYGVNERQTEAIDSMQQKYECCGAIRFEDWRSSVWRKSRRRDLIRPTEDRLVPDSCCITMTERCGVRDHPNNIQYTGCIYRMTEELENHLSILGAIGLGICVIQIFGMIFSCCVYVKLKDVLD